MRIIKSWTVWLLWQGCVACWEHFLKGRVCGKNCLSFHKQAQKLHFSFNPRNLLRTSQWIRSGKNLQSILIKLFPILSFSLSSRVEFEGYLQNQLNWNSICSYCLFEIVPVKFRLSMTACFLTLITTAAGHVMNTIWYNSFNFFFVYLKRTCSKFWCTF